MTCQRITRQWLDKHPAIHVRNSRVNVIARCSSKCANGLAKYHVICVFNVVRTTPSVRQQNCKHVYNNRRCFLCVVHAEGLKRTRKVICE
jgi:hypothetical protein